MRPTAPNKARRVDRTGGDDAVARERLEAERAEAERGGRGRRARSKARPAPGGGDDGRG